MPVIATLLAALALLLGPAWAQPGISQLQKLAEVAKARGQGEPGWAWAPRGVVELNDGNFEQETQSGSIMSMGAW